ncbi:MAG: alanine racemase [Candidatus Aminicenantes bacterium]|nr:alanine racemase [Candidatus Aminicenantes bacterium]MCJ7487034.1 alanine racemase [Candidatus Aminicenantes bacterium]
MAGALVERVEIKKSALVHNIREFRRLVGRKRKFLAVVKANAYGHGLIEVSRIALRNGVDWLGVNSVEEGVALREAGIQSPVLVIGYVPFLGLEEAVTRDLRMTVYNRETIRRLAALAVRLRRTVRLHVKVETGTWRQGVDVKDIGPFVRDILKCPGLVVEGLSSHFANIEDTTKHDYPRRQLECYRSACRELDARGLVVPFKHMSCTASTILFPEPEFNLARVGIGLYGLWPSKETYLSCILEKKKPLSLEPVLSWKARIAQVKKIPARAFVGYGCTFRTTRPTVLAVVPVGYFDGYDRGLSNAAHVLVKGRRAPVRGRVAMDFIMADVTDIPGVRLEDEVTLLGADGRERIAAEDLAALAGTISYEILSRINPLVPRIVV